MTGHTAPRIYCIPAARAPVVAVLRRGPSNWSHVGVWDLAANRYAPGAWLKGRIFPRRCDLSPDGRLFCYFVFRPNASWEFGETYVAISRLPWLRALHAFGTRGTWTRGYHFTDHSRGGCPESAKLPIPFGLSSTPIVQFATERRHGWEEARDCVPRKPGDIWDQQRNVRMQKPQPNGRAVLCVDSLGWAGGEFGCDQAVDGLRVRYSLPSETEHHGLDDIQWADWDHRGRLLVATRSGQLQIRILLTHGFEIAFAEDLSSLEPQASPAPPWAGEW